MPAIDIFGFLDETRTYFKPTVRKRQQLMMKSVTEHYRFPRSGVKPAFLKKLNDEGLAISGDSVSGYIRQYHLAYLYLEGQEREKIDALLKKGDTSTRPLQILLDNGITTWDQIIALEEERKMREQTLEAAALTVHIMQRVEAMEIDAVTPVITDGEEFPGEMTRAVHTILRAFAEVQNEAGLSREQNQSFVRNIEELQREVLALRGQLIAKDREIVRLMKEQPSSDAQAVEAIALRYAGGLTVRLMNCAEAIREESRKRNAIPDELPRKAIWRGNPDEHRDPVDITIQYGSYYMAFYRKTPDVQEQMVKQIKFLCEHGPKHNSLHTEPMTDPLYHSPADSRWSRINDKGLRFTWQFLEEDRMLILYDAGREENVKKISRTHTSIR